MMRDRYYSSYPGQGSFTIRQLDNLCEEQALIIEKLKDENRYWHHRMATLNDHAKEIARLEFENEQLQFKVRQLEDNFLKENPHLALAKEMGFFED